MSTAKPFAVYDPGLDRPRKVDWYASFAAAEKSARKRHEKDRTPLEIEGPHGLYATVRSDSSGKVWTDLAPEGALLV